MLHDFVLTNHAEILARARLRVSARNAPVPTDVEITEGLPVFLDQLCGSLQRALAHEVSDHDALEQSARVHGQLLFARGLTAAQVVHDYGDLCQVITGLAVEHQVSIGADEFQTLNLCLDDAIAGAVTTFVAQRERRVADEGTERLGLLAHEMRNALNVAMLAFASIKRGVVAPGGSTGAMLERSLLGLQSLIDRSLADVRLAEGLHSAERIPVWEILEEMAIGALLVAQARDLRFTLKSLEHTVTVLADRQLLAAALANLLQNAFKFTRPGTTVSLSARTTGTRVLIDVEDECGGLPADRLAHLVRPFTQDGSDRSGLGLGLAICVRALKTMEGELRIKDLPGQGCIFTVDLPLQPPTPTSIFAAPRAGGQAKGSPGGGGSVARAV